RADVVRGVPVHEVHARVNEVVSEAHVRVRNLESPVPAPVDRRDDDVAWPLDPPDRPADPTDGRVGQVDEVDARPLAGRRPGGRYAARLRAESEHDDASLAGGVDDGGPGRLLEAPSGARGPHAGAREGLERLDEAAMAVVED